MDEGLYQAIKETYSEAFNAIYQFDSKLKSIASFQSIVGNEWYKDKYLELDQLKDANERLTKIELGQTTVERRQLTRDRFYLAIGNDEREVRKMADNPVDYIINQLIAKANQKMDEIIVRAALGNVRIGVDGSSVVTAANDGVRTIDATGGLTYEKLLEAEQNFIDDDVHPEEMGLQKVALITGKEHTALMKEPELTSGDYSRHFVVDKGRMQEAAGYHLIKFAANAKNPILEVIGGNRQCLLMLPGAVHVGIGKEFSVSVEKRHEYLETAQIVICGEVGATRLEGKSIQLLETLQ